MIQGPSSIRPSWLRQRGMSLLSLLLLVIVLAGGGVVLVRVVPAVIEYNAVMKAAKRAAGAGNPAEARSLFDKTAQVEDISSISGRDLEIAPAGDGLRVSFAYQREFPLVGPAFLTLKFSGKAP